MYRIRYPSFIDDHAPQLPPSLYLHKDITLLLFPPLKIPIPNQPFFILFLFENIKNDTYLLYK